MLVMMLAMFYEIIWEFAEIAPEFVVMLAMFFEIAPEFAVILAMFDAILT
jgi:hypothetical protein